MLVEPVLDQSGEAFEYIASFTDGAISATGDTIEECLSMLKDRMVAQYRLLTRLPRVSTWKNTATADRRATGSHAEDEVVPRRSRSQITKKLR